MTPAGTAVLNFSVECARPGEKLSLEVVMAGEAVRAIAAELKRGSIVAVRGRLRASAAGAIGAAGIEVIASRIEARAQA